MLCTYILCATPGNNFAYRPQRQEGLLGTGTGGGGGGGGGGKEWRLETGTNPEDQGCRGPPPEQQNVKAVSARTATTVPGNCCPNCYAGQSQRQCRKLRRWETTEAKEVQLSSPAPPPDSWLFWANLRVQHHLPPLDLVWTMRYTRRHGLMYI